MQKKKINTKDGSEFTVFYLSESSAEPSKAPCCPSGPMGHKGEQGKPDLTVDPDPYEILSKLEANLEKLPKLSVPVFDFPLPSKQEIEIDDSIESDKVTVPLSDTVYKLENFKLLVKYLGEKQVLMDDDLVTLWRLEDSRGQEFYVNAELNALLMPSWSEVDEFTDGH